MRVLLLLLAAGLLAAGCGSQGGDSFDAKDIAKEQPGTAPPPMQPPGENRN